MAREGFLQELHDDLARKYQRHAAAIESAWRSFDRRQRENCLKAGAADGAVLKHSLDRSLGVVCMFMPEWNLADITEPGSDFLLYQLRHRATKSLFEQYRAGPNDEPGDYELILDMIRTKGLRHAEPFQDRYRSFLDDHRYATSFELKSHQSESLQAIAPAIRAGLIIPQSIGELIIQRQLHLLQVLTLMVDDILSEALQNRPRGNPTKKQDKAAVATAALQRLTIGTVPAKKPMLPDLVSIVRGQHESLEVDLGLVSTEPIVLAHVVNLWFFSRPDLIADDRGCRLLVHTDKYISAAFFEAVHNAVEAVAIWNYLKRLLELLQQSMTAGNKLYQNMVLQEIANVSCLEYSRTQDLLKRHVQTGTGSKWFRRASNGQDKAGRVRVTMKRDPEELIRSDAQLHYLLRLCQPATNASKAIEPITKLAELHEAHPLEREKLQGRETDSLGDLVVIAGLMQDLASVVPMPPMSRKKGHMFVSKYQDLERELGQLKDEIDVRDFAAPIDYLMEPGMMEGALNKMDQVVVSKKGTKLGFLYQDLVQDCISDIQSRHQQAKAQAAKEKDAQAPEPGWAYCVTTSSSEERIEQPRQKLKTRPAHSSAFETTTAALSSTPSAHEAKEPAPMFKVSSSTADVFSTLFIKSQSRGTLSWTCFVAAMADVGFSVEPKFGSVYTFRPPATMATLKPISLHRPHDSQIEGYRSLIIARRLERVYGWGEQTFQAMSALHDG